jgi:hypothetical protein
MFDDDTIMSRLKLKINFNFNFFQNFSFQAPLGIF